MAASPKYADLSDSITSGLANIRKWYGKTDDTDAYFVCLGTRFFMPLILLMLNYIVVLDPNVKAAYAQNRWAARFFKEGMRSLEKVVRDISLNLSNIAHNVIYSSTSTSTRIPHLLRITKFCQHRVCVLWQLSL
jgi:hypothetical protein